MKICDNILRQIFIAAFLFLCISLAAQDDSLHSPLPGEKNKTPAIEYGYFPSTLHTFVWRNWFLIPVDHLAKVVQTTPKNITTIAKSMGLPKQPNLLPEWSTSRGYITVLKRNWHLLPYDQILQLLKMSRQELSTRLIEDDFLMVKLGQKPYCEPLLYTTPTKEMDERAQQIANNVKELGKNVFDKETPRFKFIHEYASKEIPQIDVHPLLDGSEFDLRIIFSYFTDYGDPLIDPELSSYPERLLKELSDLGINGIWMHSVLRMLVPPDGIFPGENDYMQRINGLRKLVERASKYGIGIYLYSNEPRAMPISFFESDPKRLVMGGEKEGELQAFCTSEPQVLDWLSRSYEKIFREVPGLAGVFTITASENLTSCASHWQHSKCPKCSKHDYSDLISDVNAAITDGVKKGNPDANVIVWDWGWNDSKAEAIIKKLPSSCWFMSVSEWNLPIERGGIKSSVGEYSISSVGPGPRALKHWEFAKQAGLKTVAKVQVNCTWELSILPSLPVMDLVAQHAENLKKVSTDGVLLSWSLGGFPSLNLEIFQSVKPGKVEETLNSFALTNYGEESAPYIRKAWSSFSDGFKEYPYHITTVYKGPQQIGPSNQLFVKPTNYKATMTGFPYDDIQAWCAIYPADIWISQMDKVSEGFKSGCEWLRKAEKVADKSHKQRIKSDLLRATVAQIHFASSARQAAFVKARNAYLASEDSSKKKEYLKEMRECVLKEKDNVTTMLPLVKEDPTVGYESANQYFYLPIDLVEKYVNIKAILSWLDSEVSTL